MYPYYAIIENGAVVEYPANPELYQTGLVWDWQGGILGDKTFVYCHNIEPDRHPTQNVVEDGNPVLNPENNLWYRNYKIVPASPEEIAKRLVDYTAGAEEVKTFMLTEGQRALADLAPVPPETQQQWDEYFAEIQAVNNQPDFPWVFNWPTRPDKKPRIKATVERI